MTNNVTPIPTAAPSAFPTSAQVAAAQAAAKSVTDKALGKPLKATPPNKPAASPATGKQAQLPLGKADIVAPTRDVPLAVCPTLLTILAWRRRHMSPSEGAFNNWLEGRLKEMAQEVNGKGSQTIKVERRTSMKHVVVQVSDDQGRESDVLFSSHVDTQDSLDRTMAGTDWGALAAINGLHQKLVYDPNFGHIMLDTKDPNAGGCLGADDGIGVWIMLNMIAARVPGSYVFHRGEECGGISAAAAVREDAEWLKKHNMAVAFDRPRYNEVIISQGGATCASFKFGAALAHAINQHDPDKLFDFRTSTDGVFTDTKLYRGLIAECVNIGVGYEDQHGTKEFQDYGHALALMEACCKIDWTLLPIDRDPASAASEYNGSQRWGHDDDWGDADGWAWTGKGYAKNRSVSAPKPPKSSAPPPKPMVPSKHTVFNKDDVDLDPLSELDGMSVDDVSDLVEKEPAGATALIMSLAVELAASRARVRTLTCFLDMQ